MKNEILKDIAEYAKKKLMAEYEYCGEAGNDSLVILNSGDGDSGDIAIKISVADLD